MTAFFVGVKMVTAWPQEQAGQPGYAVKYEDGYISWSPADVFERSYFELTDHEGSKLTEFDINRFLGSIEVNQLDEKTTLVRTVHMNGFVSVEASSCVDPKNYDHEIGTEICLRKIRDKIWSNLGFVLQWAKSGLQKEEKRLEM